MPFPTGLTAGLAFLPTWLKEAKDGTAWETALCGWVRATGWKSAGLVWPLIGTPMLAQSALADTVDTLPTLPAELSDVAVELTTGQPTVVWQVPGGAGRLYTLLQPAGRPAGAVWVERATAEPWTEADRQFLILSVRLMERSPALAAKVGPALDPDRLQQRLSDAAVIAGRMAHDFDNILQGIIGFSDLSVPLVPAGSQPAKFLAEIGKVGQRGIQFTQQLHQLSRSGQAKPQPGQLSPCLAKEEARLRAVAPAGVQVRIDVPTACELVGMDNAPLTAMVGHLMENAVEASPPHAVVRVSARPVELTAADARAYLGRVSPGPHVELTVQDSGPGIRPDIRAKMFAEPFFTTKVRHRGLGLAIVYRTLHAHAGGIRIDPVPPPDTGTVVRVVVPPAARPLITTPRPTVVTRTA
jgi:signal transduction histidine kinase